MKRTRNKTETEPQYREYVDDKGEGRMGILKIHGYLNIFLKAKTAKENINFCI